VQEAIAPRRVLVLYWASSAPTEIRSAIRHHLEAIKRGPSSHLVTFWNAFDGVPALVRRGRYDAVILHTTLLCLRWFESFSAWHQKLSWLDDLDCLKIAMPQDEYNHSVVLDEWLSDLGVGHVFSIFGTDVRPLIYPRMAEHAQFESAFTGYIDESTALRLEKRLLVSTNRPLDVVYRATHPAYWFGRLGQLKHQIGERAQVEAEARGLTADISTRTADAVIGDEWFDFLAAGRVVVGSESGSSVLDRRGEIQASIRTYLQAHPGATFDEVAARMPDGWDSYHFGALSPRHVEAVITKTCQVLVKGGYSDVLVPGRHYLPVQPDLADLGEVLEAASDPAVASQLADRAYEEIYRSGRYSYRTLAEQIDRVLETRPPRRASLGSGGSALAARLGSWRLGRPSDQEADMTAGALLLPAAELSASAMPSVQVWRLLRYRHGRQMVVGAIRKRISRRLLRVYLGAGKSAASISAGRLLAEGRLLDRMSRAQAVQPRTPSFRVVKATGEGTALELSVLRKPPHDAQTANEQSWPPSSIVVRLPSFGGLTTDAAGGGMQSAVRLEAVSALAAIRPVPVYRAIQQLLDSIGGARSRPRMRGGRNRIKAFVANTRVVFDPPGNLWLLAASVGRAPLRDLVDDLLKLALLRNSKRTAPVGIHFDAQMRALRWVSEPSGVDRNDHQIQTQAEADTIVWDNSSVSDYVYAPVALGRRLTVFLGAGGVHEFTAIEALPRSFRTSIMRRLEDSTSA